MKILFACNSLISGGAERLLSQLVPKIKNAGNDCHLLLLSSKDSRYLDAFRSNEIEVTVVPDFCKTHFAKMNYVKKYIKNGNFDVIHANLFPMFYYLAFLKKSFRKSTVLTLTEHSTSNKRRKHFVFRLIERFVYSKYDAKICISKATEENLIKWLAADATDDSFVVIENGIDLSIINKTPPVERNAIFSNASSEDCFLAMVGSFTSDKNHSFILDVLSCLPSRFKLLLLGEGKLKNEIESKVHVLNLDNRVAFGGFVSNPYSFIKACDIVIIPSKREGFGLIAVEAMACGKPIVCSNVDGLRSVVNDAGIKCNLIVEEFASAIKTIEKNASIYIERGQAMVTNYDIKLTVERYLSLFEYLVHKKGKNDEKRK